MKYSRLKTLLLAAPALAVCGPALAQSNVTLYGNVDVYLESFNTTGKPAVTQLSSGGLAPSKWGMRGSEDLGGGLKTTFNFESGFRADTGAGGSAMFERAANVGLESARLGKVVLGRQNAPMDDAMVWTDSDWASNFSPITPLLLNPGSAGYTSVNTATGAPQTALMHLRQSNLISYNTPKFGGVDGKIAFGPGEGATVGPLGAVRNTVGASVRYSDGPLLATAALHHGGFASAEQNAYNLAVRYKFGFGSVSGDYYKNTNKLANGTEPGLNGVVVGVLVPNGPWAYVAQYGRVTDNGLDYKGAAKATGKSDLLNLGVHYYLSKSTIVYARATYVKDTDGGFNGQPYTAAWGISPSYLGLDTNGKTSTTAIGLLKFF